MTCSLALINFIIRYIHEVIDTQKLDVLYKNGVVHKKTSVIPKYL